MSKVDNRIVKMSFDNKQFEKGVSTSMGTLKKLEQSLQLKDAKNGLSSIQGAIDKVSFGHMQGGIDGISKSFIGLSTVAITALSNITNKAVDAGINLGKALTVDAKSAGFAEYELKMGAIQTIMAGSGASLDVVNQKLKELNDYSDLTIYSFADMTQNIGKFTNAGVSLDQSVAAIKGVANVAALSGANAEEASRSMYNFSQALSSGAVRLEDWRSIELANMGTIEFKQQLIDAAVAAGTLTKAGDGLYKTLEGNTVSATKFNESLQDQWLTSGVLVDTLGKYADINTDIGARATAAASDVKTFTQLIDTLKESAASGWAETFEIVIGDFDEAKQLWTGINNVVSEWIGNSAEARNSMLRNWKEAGGRDAVINGFKNAFKALGNVIKPIQEAFRNIFPKSTGDTLVKLSKGFESFTEKLIIGESAMNAIRGAFTGVFAIVSVVKQVFTGLLTVLGTVFKAIFSGAASAGGALDIFGKIGGFFTNLDAWLQEGNRLQNFFDQLGTYISIPIKYINEFRAAIASAFSGGTTPFLENLKEKFQDLAPVIETVQGYLQQFGDFVRNAFGNLGDFLNFGSSGDKAVDTLDRASIALASFKTPLEDSVSLWDRFKQAMTNIGNAISPILDKIKNGFTNIKDAFMNFVGGLDMFDLIAALDVGILVGAFVWIRGLFKDFRGILEGVGDVLGSTSGVLDQVSSSLKTMQRDVQSQIIMRIAIALVILVAAIALMSLIDPGKLGAAMGALVLLLTVLVVTVKALDKIYANKSLNDTAKMTVLSLALIALAVSLALFAVALYILGSIPTDKLQKGLLTVAGVLVALVGAAAILEKSGGAGGLIKAAVALGILALSLLLLAGVLLLYSKIDPNLIADSLIKIAISMVVISTALKTFPKGAIKDAAALFIVSAALVILAFALKQIAEISVGDMIKTAIMIAVTLGIIGFALTLMQGNLAGAAALLVVSAALLILAGVMAILATIPWDGIGKGLAAIVGLLVIIGLAAVAFGYIAPLVLGMGYALLLLATAALVGGLALMALGAGLATLAVTGSAGILVLTGAIIAVAQLIPFIMYQIGLGLIAFANVVKEAAPQIGEAFGAVLKAGLDQVIAAIPQFGEVVQTLIDTLLNLINENKDDFFQTGWDIIISFLTGIRDNIYEVVTVGLEIMEEFLSALEDKLPDVADQAFDTVITFIDELSATIRDRSAELGEAGGELVGAIIEGMVKGVASGGGALFSSLKGLASDALNAAKNFLGINSPARKFIPLGEGISEGFAVGVDSYSGKVQEATRNVGDEAFKNMQDSLGRIRDLIDADAEMNPVITPVLDLTKIKKDIPKLNNLGRDMDLGAKTNYRQAVSVASGQNKFAESMNSVDSQAPVIQFEQNNYSPKALSAVDIYRQTRNQISMAKEALRV